MKKNSKFLFGLTAMLLAVAALVVVMTGCRDPTSTTNYYYTGDGGGDQPAEIVGIRYKTVPYSAPAGSVSASLADTAARSASVSSADNLALVYSAKDATFKYYTYYAGYVDFVPLLYKDAIWYDGRTAMTIGYEKSSGTENAISTALSKAVENSMESSTSQEHSVEVTAGVEFGPVSVSASYGFTQSTSKTVGSSVSTSNTYETSAAKIEGESWSMEVVVGGNGEEAGMYRFALFATTDVFYQVTVKSDGSVEDVKVALCARPTTYWGVDYDPQPGGSATFGKTGDGDLLAAPNFDEFLFPEPANVVASPPTASPASSEGTSTVTVTLYAESGASIRYTTDGSDPSDTSGTEYSAPFAITTPGMTTVKAVAYTDGKLASPVMMWNYTIIPAGVAYTGWTSIRSSNAKTIKDVGYFANYCDSIRFDQFTLTGGDSPTVNISSLKSEYTSVSIFLEMDVKELDDGYQYIALYSSATTSDNYKVGGPIKFEHGSGSKKTTAAAYTFDFQNVPLTDFTGDTFVIRYNASGDNDDDWQTDNLKIRLVFNK
jgi:hypothetical protein